jgi:hypothetical protein
MDELISAAGQLAWPLALVVSWMPGELAHRLVGMPRISVYGVAGFLAGKLAVKVQGPIDHSPFLLLEAGATFAAAWFGTTALRRFRQEQTAWA